MMIKLSKITNLLLISLILLTSCAAPKWLKPSKVDTRKTPVNAKERAQKNLKDEDIDVVLKEEDDMFTPFLNETEFNKVIAVTALPEIVALAVASSAVRLAT